MLRVLLFVIGLLYGQTGFMQSSNAVHPPSPRHYFFTHFTTATGLVSFQINSTVQDEDGYIWIGTNDGLQRFDGVRFKTFRHSDNDSTTLPSNLIWQLLIDREKNLWILTIDGKAGIFNTKTFRFTPVKIKVKNEVFFLSNAPFKRLITDEFGNIFLLVPGSELVTYNKSTHTFDPHNNFQGFPQQAKINAFTQEPGTHKYWMSVAGQGLTIYNSVSHQTTSDGNNTENEHATVQSVDNRNITNIYFDKQGRLWIINNIADTPSVSCYDIHKQQTILSNYHFDRRILGFHEIRNFFQQKDSTIWIIGQKIFARYLEKEKQFEQVYNGYEEEHGIDYITMTTLMEDREHSIWASTANNGIFRYNPSKDFFSNIRYISHTTNLEGVSAPVSFMPDKDGSLLVGTREDGFYRFDKNFKQVPLHIKGIADKNTTVIWNMYASADSNTMWMATQHGIYRYDQNKKQAFYFSPAVLSNKTVKRITEDKMGNLWLGTQEAGVFKWNREKGKDTFEEGLSAFENISPVRINRIITDKKGYVWVATNGDGAYMIDPANDSICRHFYLHGSGEMKISEQSVLSVLEYNDSLMVIGTSSRLMVYNRLRQKTYPLGNALSGFFASVEKDDSGHLWVSTTTSIYRVTVSNRVFLQMNRNDGLINDYFLAGASYVLSDKRMLFGVYGAIICFLPSSVNTAPMYPDLKITGFMLKDKSLRVDSLLRQKVIVLPPEDNSITIDLSVLSYNSGYLLKYKLENLDKTWKVVDQNYQLVYSYLPPGKYTLHVETVDAEGKTGEKSLQLSIRIYPPYWKTWWFYGLLLLLALLLLFWLDLQRNKRRDAIQMMRSNIAGNLHREVNTALNNINILSEMAKLKADTSPEKSKEFIRQINVKSEQMIIAMDDMLWSIDPVNDGMQKNVERLREYIDLLNTRHSAGIELLVDKSIEKLKLDMQLRHEALLLFKESIHAQVQSGASSIKVHITLEKSHIVYSTQFNPENCDMKQLNHFFYSKENEKRVKAIHAKFSVDKNKSNMMVMLKMPFA